MGKGPCGRGGMRSWCGVLVTNRIDQETGIESLAIPGMWGMNPGNWQRLRPIFLGVPIPGITRMGFGGSRVQIPASRLN